MSTTRSLKRPLLVSSSMGGEVLLSLYSTTLYIKAAHCCHHACFGAMVMKRKIAIREKFTGKSEGCMTVSSQSVTLVHTEISLQ